MSQSMSTIKYLSIRYVDEREQVINAMGMLAIRLSSTSKQH